MWKGTTDLTAAPMDDFKVILGMKFLSSIKVISIPHLGIVRIMEKVHDSDGVHRADKGTNYLYLTLKSGFKKNKIIFLTILVNKEGPTDAALSSWIAKVLDEFKDVMRRELLKKLPPQREVYHNIELEPEAKPPTMVLYHVAPP